MKKKITKIICAVLAAAFALGIFAGCDLLVTDNRRDMEQVVAEVNIGSDSDALTETFELLGATLGEGVSSRLGDILSTDEIYKRDLVAYFLSYGYNYISQGSSYAQAFRTIMDGLVDRKLVAQFATVCYLNAGSVDVDRDSIDKTDKGYSPIGETDGLRMSKEISVDGYLAALEGKEGDAAAVAGFEYFLTEDEINYANYLVMSSINSAIDTYEEEIIVADSSDTTTSGTSRAVPTGANTISDTYYPKKEVDGATQIDYDIYTGYNNVSDCGEYEKLDGSTVYTRTRAYARFLNSLRQNYLIQDGESAVTDVKELSYYTVELKTQLEQRLITKFNATLTLSMANSLTAEVLGEAYSIELRQQQESAKTASSFTTTMDSLSDTSFVVYSPDERTYGYVYNILLPFNATQTLNLAEVSQRYTSGTAEYYAARNADEGILKAVRGTDQREYWFNGDTDYSYVAEGEYYQSAANAGREKKYLFFEDSYVTSDEGIARYAGKYPYSGAVTENEDGTYSLTPDKLDIDQFITEMNAYINWYVNYSLGNETDENYTSGGYFNKSDSGMTWDASDGGDFYATTAKDFPKDANGKIDQSANIYYKGKVSGISGSDGKTLDAANYLTEGTVSYAALCAVNELMFAYTTDTACLNTYFGYSIASIEESTTYVAEFEYASQEAIQKGAGTYYVVATDYGWHIIYVSFVFNGGETYAGGFNYQERNNEGTFSYYYYQAKKSEVTSSYSTDAQNDIITLLNNDSVVSTYPGRYADLTSIG